MACKDLVVHSDTGFRKFTSTCGRLNIVVRFHALLDSDVGAARLCLVVVLSSARRSSMLLGIGNRKPRNSTESTRRLDAGALRRVPDLVLAGRLRVVTRILVDVRSARESRGVGKEVVAAVELVREERDQQRRERAAREARSRPTTLRPAGAGALVPLVVASSSSREAAREAMMGQAARQKIQTLPGNGASRRRLTKKMQTQKERKQQACANGLYGGGLGGPVLPRLGYGWLRLGFSWLRSHHGDKPAKPFLNGWLRRLRLGFQLEP
ncbi:hypothetical protein B0H14DRAFT_2556220 [Mycena olivaceomarginata]|nr:hypothetical protein B0H14DRAFT_2556220 [Mycena olivaceomarginata]